jgi:hypothetical protein
MQSVIYTCLLSLKLDVFLHIMEELLIFLPPCVTVNKKILS